MDRSGLGKHRNRTHGAFGRNPLAAVLSSRPRQSRGYRHRPASQTQVLADYTHSLAAHTVKLEQIKGHKDVSAVDGFVECAAIVGALMNARWQDKARALTLAARAVSLSQSFLKEFLEASGSHAGDLTGMGG
jgi:hypothetical protein